MKIDWSQFKSFVNARKLDILMLSDDNFYYLFANEGQVSPECAIPRGDILNTDLVDFEDSYLALCNPEKIEKVKPTSPLNEHCMQPWGCERGYFRTKGASEGDYVCAITLSNKSQDGKTFNYQEGISIIPTIGNYVFQSNATKRSWVTAVNTTNRTITFEKPILDEGDGIYSKGMYLDVEVRDWASVMYLWGLTLTVIERDAQGVIEDHPCSDFIELSVIDKNAVYPQEALLANGFEINGEYLDNNGNPIPTKYYDESWVLSCNGSYTPAPDGSPGELLPYLHLRLSLFTLENEEHIYEVLTDYYPTSKS
jgi:hypothetical protein